MKNQKPNILFIMTDQHRFDYMNCMGTEFLNTPNLDKLANEGILFNNCFTNSPVCAPARIGLATGLQPWRIGSVDNNSFLSLNRKTHYQLLRDNNYRVGCVGKLDLAKPNGYNGRHGDRPCTYSFGFTHPQECEGKMHAFKKPTPQGPYTYYLQKKGLLKKFYEKTQGERSKNNWIEASSYPSVLNTEDFEDVYIGRNSVEWLKEVLRDFPWFFFASFVGPHDPFDPPEEFIKNYKDKDIPEPIRDNLESKPAWIKQRAEKYDCNKEKNLDKVKKSRRHYAAYVELIDREIGKMLSVLEERGMLDNTYIIFTSDHGEMLGDHGLYIKHVAYEPSMHVPLIISGPEIESDQETDVLVELIDLHLTVLDLADISYDENNFDSKSLLPLLYGQSDKHRQDVITAERNYRAIRTKRYKYIENYNDRDELYDLKRDPEELNNIIEINKSITDKLKNTLKKRYKEGCWLK